MKTKPPSLPLHSGRGASKRRRGSPTRWKRTLQSRLGRGYLRSLNSGLLNHSISQPETPALPKATKPTPTRPESSKLHKPLSKECHPEEKEKEENRNGALSTPTFGSTAKLESLPPVQDFELNDPFRDPVEIPLTTGMFVYRHSASAISSTFHDRFHEIQNYFRRNTENHPELKAHVEHIVYAMKMCGPSVSDSHPSIIVFCRPSEFKALRSLLNEKHLKRQWCRRKSSPPYLFWKNWGKGNGASDLEKLDHKPLFNLYFWQTAQPRNLLCLESTQISLRTETLSPLTLSGASTSIPHSDGQGVSRSTIAGILRVDASFYALTAAHGIQQACWPSKSGLKECSLSPSFQWVEHAMGAETSDKPLSAHGLLRSDGDDDGDGEDDDFVSDIEYEDADELASAKGELEQAKASPTSMTEFEDGIEKPTLTLKASWICPRSQDLPNFDWAVVALDSEDLIRPNALIDVTSTESHRHHVYFWDMVENLPVRETAVLVHTKTGIQKAMLQTATACLGTLIYTSHAQAQYWTLIMCEGSSLSHGDSGSVVVDAITHSAYGHVVASNPLGEIYISPMTGAVNQIKESLSAGEVALPEPLHTMTKLACHYLEHQLDEAFHILAELSELTKYSNRMGVSRRQIRSWERSTTRQILSQMASTALSQLRGAKAEKTKILRRFILESHLALSNLRDASPPGGFPPVGMRLEASGPTASTPSPPPSPSPRNEPNSPARGAHSNGGDVQGQVRLGQRQFHLPASSIASALPGDPVVERDSQGNSRVEEVEPMPPGENIDTIHVRARPALTRPRRNSMEEDHFYRDLMTSRPKEPPSYETAMRDALREKRSGATALSARNTGKCCGMDDGGNPPPEYTCEIHLEGVFMRKMEIENLCKRAESSSWNMVYGKLHGTALTIYNVKKERGWWSAKSKSPDINPDNPPWVKKGPVEKMYNLAHADVGIAADYRKRRYVMRLRLEDEQFLLSCVELPTFVAWLDQLFAALGVVAPIEERDFPSDHSIPRLQRIRWLRSERPTTEDSADENVEGTARDRDGYDEDAQNEPHLASQPMFGRFVTGTEYPNENIDPRTGKWAPRHEWTTRHDQLYARLCYRVLLFKSPRKSNYIIRQGKRWYVDWATGRMVRVLPPRYDELECFGPWQVFPDTQRPL